MHKGSNKRRTNTSRDILVSRLARKYRMRWMDAYYCCEMIDSLLDKFLALGFDLTVEGIMSIRHDVSKIENIIQLAHNSAYLSRVIKGDERFYHHKHLPDKYLRLKK